MKENMIVQFVSFETTLDSEAFIVQWNQFHGALNSDGDATLQQHALDNGSFKYISQHRCGSSLFQFVLGQERRSPKIPRTQIRRRQAGGYTLLQLECDREPRADESKILAFVINPVTDLDVFRQIASHGKLNIYQAYYENCAFAYILEFIVRNKYVPDILQELKTITAFAEAGVYKECHL